MRIDRKLTTKCWAGSSDWLGLFLSPWPLIESSTNKTRSLALGECGKKKTLEHAPLAPRKCLRVNAKCACCVELQSKNTLQPTIVFEIIPRYRTEPTKRKLNDQLSVAKLKARWDGREADGKGANGERNEQTDEIGPRPPVVLMVSLPKVCYCGQRDEQGQH